MGHQSSNCHCLCHCFLINRVLSICLLLHYLPHGKGATFIWNIDHDLFESDTRTGAGKHTPPFSPSPCPAPWMLSPAVLTNGLLWAVSHLLLTHWPFQMASLPLCSRIRMVIRNSSVCDLCTETPTSCVCRALSHGSLNMGSSRGNFQARSSTFFYLPSFI